MKQIIWKRVIINIDNLKIDHKEFIKNNELILTQQRFKSERHSFGTEEISKITLSSSGFKW